MSALTDVAEVMEAAGLGTRGTDLFVNQLPAEPDTVTAAISWGGTGPSMSMGTGLTTHTTFKLTNLQIQCRDHDPEAAENQCEAVYDALAGKKLTAASGAEYSFIPRQSPAKLKEDENKRLVFYCEFTLSYRG